jgi:CelD/BcsL family acetyltransferase involved in cellulose biosynthesis
VTGVLTLEPVSDLASVRNEWSYLAAGGGNPFLTWEWASTWWRHWGRGRRSLVTACRRDGDVAAILPLYESARRPLRVLRLLGHGPGDHLGMVCAPADRAAAAAALRRRLAEEAPAWDLCFAERLPAEEGWAAALRATVVRREVSPVLKLGDAGWAGFLAARSPHLRKRIAYAERRLARAGALRFRLADDPERLGCDLDALFALHAARWGERASGALAPGRQAFHREFAALALERGWLRLWLLELDERPAAAWYGLRFGGAEWHYQSGRDPALDRLSVGFVLLAHSIRAAAEDGIGTYRFLRGDEAYKHRLADDGGTTLETVALARGAAGRAALRVGPAALGLARRGPESLRRRAVGLAG